MANMKILICLALIVLISPAASCRELSDTTVPQKTDAETGQTGITSGRKPTVNKGDGEGGYYSNEPILGGPRSCTAEHHCVRGPPSNN